MRYFLRLLPALFLLAPSCADDDLQPRRNETDLEALDRLVPITQTGAGTFGCLLNGELWIPESDLVENAIDALSATTSPNNISLTARKRPISDQRDHILKLATEAITDTQTPLKSFSGWTDRDGVGTCSSLDVDTLQENFILVTHFDQSSRIVSGRFEAVFTNPNCPQDTIKITEGRFDLPYRD